MADIESRVATYREELKACIVSDSVLSRLQSIIPQGEYRGRKELSVTSHSFS